MNAPMFKFSTSVLAWPLGFVLTIWVVYSLEIILPGDFLAWGIFPRTFTGIFGILFSPFLHNSVQHLYNNTIPLFVLLAALRFFYRSQSVYVLVFGLLLSGLGTWIIGRDSYHIGASGFVYVLASFIFFKGIITKYFRLVALSLGVVLWYGGMVWYVFPGPDVTMSWEAHLSGFVVGFLLAVYTPITDYQKAIVYDWQDPNFDSSQDEFIKHFDANGNFAPIISPKIRATTTTTYQISQPNTLVPSNTIGYSVGIVYVYKPTQQKTK